MRFQHPHRCDRESDNQLNTHCLTKTQSGLDALSKGIESVTAWLILPLTFLTLAVATLRHVFDYGRIDLQEAVVYLHATILALCMAGLMKKDGHVRIDIFYRKMQPRHKALINCFGMLALYMPFCITTLVLTFNYAARSWSVLEASPEAGGLPLVFLLKSLLPVMAILLLLQGLSTLLSNTRLLRKDH